jgi:hypothetical protein
VTISWYPQLKASIVSVCPIAQLTRRTHTVQLDEGVQPHTLVETVANTEPENYVALVPRTPVSRQVPTTEKGHDNK